MQLSNWLFSCCLFFQPSKEKYNIVNIKVVQSMVTVLAYIDMYLYTLDRASEQERVIFGHTISFFTDIFPNGRFTFQNETL